MINLDLVAEKTTTPKYFLKVAKCDVLMYLMSPDIPAFKSDVMEQEQQEWTFESFSWQ